MANLDNKRGPPCLRGGWTQSTAHDLVAAGDVYGRLNTRNRQPSPETSATFDADVLWSTAEAFLGLGLQLLPEVNLSFIIVV